MCNAEAIKDFNVPVVNSINEQFPSIVRNWLNGAQPQVHYICSIQLRRSLML
jgi:hypothetical protein